MAKNKIFEDERFEDVFGDDEPVLTCDICHQGIYDGERYYDYFGDIICADCIKDVVNKECAQIAEKLPHWEKMERVRDREDERI